MLCAKSNSPDDPDKKGPRLTMRRDASACSNARRTGSGPQTSFEEIEVRTALCIARISSNRTSGPDPESESAELAEDAIAQVAVLLDGKGESVYSPFPDRGRAFDEAG